MSREFYVPCAQYAYPMDNVFKLVEFKEENNGQKKSVDIIPSNWIAYDMNTDGLVAKFMSPPYDEENSALLHSLIECCAPAPQDWPAYPVTVRGGAKTYQEGLKKLKVLDQKDHAFSTDEECSSNDKSKMVMEFYKTEQRNSNKLWEVPELTDENLNPMSDMFEPVALSTQPAKKNKGMAKKIKVVENKIITEPFKSAHAPEQQSTPPLVLFNDMVPVIKDGALLEDIKAAVTKGFYSQSLHLAQISTQLEELKIMFKEGSASKMSELPNLGSPAKKHNLVLPFKNMQDFADFDAKLLADEKFRDDMIASMWRIASICAPIQQTVRDILRKFISRDIVVQFTAVKNTGKKQVLSKTKFFSCVQDVVIAKYASDAKNKFVSTKDFEQAVGRVINNAKDWDGNRAIRQKNSQ